jgi:hypothetical protein
MTDDRFDELMRDAAHTYRRPPAPDLDGMWKAIERESFGTVAGGGSGRERPRPRGLALVANRWTAIAATLVLGIGLGRASASLGRTTAAPQAATPMTVASATPAARTDSSTLARPYEVETSRYLGQTAALLIALPSEARAGRADEQLASRASDLLGRTRLLLDSPAANDPAMRNLLEDLELVLAQVARLQNGHSRTDLDLINRALEQRDVLPRLRNAVGDISAN